MPFILWQTIHLGPLTLQVWGLFVSLGILLTWLILWQRGRYEKLNQKLLWDVAFGVLIFGLIGARLFTVIFYEPRFYFSAPLEILKIWRGGLSSFGGIVGAIIGFAYFCRQYKISLVNRLKFADVLSFSALFGWLVGRLGCFFIHDHPGKLSNSFLALNAPGGARLDMAFLEILALMPLAILFILIRNKRLYPGFYLLITFTYYGLLRFVLDFFRSTDLSISDVRYFGLTPAQYFGMILVFLSLVVWRRSLKSKVKSQKP